MSRRIILTAVLIFVAGAAAGVRAQDGAAEEKRRASRRLIELNRAAEAGVQVFEMMLPDMRKVFGALLDSLPAAKRELAVRIMVEESRRAFTAERMVEELAPVYEKYLTAEDINALVAFYESPAGRKFVAVQPLLIRESGAVGEKIAQEAIERINRRYQEEGINVPPPPPARRTPPPRRRP